MTYDDWKCADPNDRYLGTEPHVCKLCGSDLVDDCHDVTCEFHPEFWEPDVPDFDPRDEWDSPVDRDVDGGLGE